MARYYYASTIKEFLQSNTVLQTLCQGSEFDINLAQRDAWQKEIAILKIYSALTSTDKLLWNMTSRDLVSVQM